MHWEKLTSGMSRNRKGFRGSDRKAWVSRERSSCGLGVSELEEP